MKGDKKNPIIRQLREIKNMLERANACKEQVEWMQKVIKAARPVKCVPAASVLDETQIEYIKRVLKPEPKHCYLNSHMLCEAFPDEIKYCEGKTAIPFEIDHAFNKVGDKYIDITFEFALGEDPRKYPYVVLGEYDADEIDRVLEATKTFGGYFAYLNQPEE